MDQPLLERLAAWLRQHPFGVDAALTAFTALALVVAPASEYPAPEATLLVGLLLIVPLAWRRRRPVRATAVVVLGCLLELVVLPGTFIPANIAAPVMVYALAAYAPRWASA